MPLTVGYTSNVATNSASLPAKTENSASKPPPERNVGSSAQSNDKQQLAQPVRRPEPVERGETNIGNNIDVRV